MDCRPIQAGKDNLPIKETPGFPVVFGRAIADVTEWFRHADTCSVGVYCDYGQHRSPAVAEMLADTLSILGVTITSVDHY